ncbi:MAG TPA: uroporphyrinogen-III synthase [Xanthomonadales bacterium]|nr:uroporphyrinogen-III synthase [Xanthomonadales bacterium]
MSTDRRKPIILLTRPRRESRLTAHALATHGIDCIRIPLQSTRRAPPTSALESDLLWAATAGVQIFVSKAAVAAALAGAAAQVAAASTRIAVGRATAAALHRQGFSAITSAGHAQDSDGVLALAPLQQVHGVRIAIWAAPGGRERIAQVLEQRGAQLRVIGIYRRLPQRPRPAALRRLVAAADRSVLTATSNTLLEALDRELKRRRLAALHQRPLIVASERIADHARALGFGRVTVAAGASAQALIAALEDPSLFGTLGCMTGNDPLPSLKTKS